MFVLDFDSDSKKAFAHGFVKGLAAPVSLFHSEPAPKIKLVQPIARVHQRSVRDALRADWKRVGDHLHGAMNERQKQAASA